MARKGPKAVAPEQQAEDTHNQSLQEQIAALAHALWHQRGCPEGSPEEDWLRAEQEIKEQRNGEIVTMLRQVPSIATRAQSTLRRRG
jgi:hypothetical protein